MKNEKLEDKIADVSRIFNLNLKTHRETPNKILKSWLKFSTYFLKTKNTEKVFFNKIN